MALKTLEKHELRNVMGGNKWGNAVIGAATGATRGVSWCRGGPWGMTACGLGGAAIGGYLGYKSN